MSARKNSRSIDSEDRERSVERLVDRTNEKAVRPVVPVNGHGLPRDRQLEQPGQKLRGEQREPAAENNSRDLTLCPALAKHEHQATDDDRDKGERTCEWSRERDGEIVSSAFPRRLCEGVRRWDQDRYDSR